ncbi:hypothetical protein TPHA_0A05410 [Tetrapisispora phaffii CBS 4417]|uniref:Clathrin/coatomer adaptor adaptin-like N-terminal domain-containing protein n=1 Tax=Tetrapisispora phaffii (strain ATCC 24235 / CBS 4417 / NBRC 1672 / NRRL Y-8282 / UCD 70-5) TaxID=1071381 RepID=G8BNY7_TETPH|nr:hypothetical protein TPHA_0A05410 [Tetrapisispora phaffii CBS 4417]CCE61615.1 hypothetical protein TPHA_0A05410 [Tetrapisispora phaffii CBS 4417]
MVDSINRVTSALQSAREITLDAANVAASKLGESSYRQYSKNITPSQLKTLLTSKYTSEVKDGLKRVLSIMASHDETIDPLLYFADVVNNIVNEDFKVKTMVALYLQRYSELEPTLALLPINYIQKTLNDTNPQVRALAIKTLSDIKIPTIYPMVLHTLNKSVSDISPIVRNEVCFALLKLYRAKQEEVEQDVLTLLTENLLTDSDPQVLASSILLFKECFPSRLDILHGHFRYLLEIMTELDSWSQVYLIEVLIKYSKRYFPKPMIIETNSDGDFFGESKKIELPNEFGLIEFQYYKATYDKDLNAFLETIVSLKYNNNPSVILAVTNAFVNLSTPKRLEKSGNLNSLVNTFIITDNKAVKLYILEVILTLVRKDSSLFQRFIKNFYLLPSDSCDIATVKLKILASLVTDNNINNIVKEAKYYIYTSEDTQVITAAAHLLLIAGNHSQEWEVKIMRWFIEYLQDNLIPISVLDSFITILCRLILNNPKRHMRSVIKLSKMLESQKYLADNARAGMIWLFGEVARIELRICLDILRKLIPGFSNEGPETRCQILSFAAKLISYDIDKFVTESESDVEEYNFADSKIYQLYEVVISLSKYDESVDIRDRARFISSIFDSKKYKIASLLFQAPRSVDLGDSQELDRSSNVENQNIFSKLFELDNIQWWTGGVENTTELRNSSPRKEYAKFQKSFSSEDYPMKSKRAALFGDEEPKDVNIAKSPNTEFISNQGKKYHLQSLDEFFQIYQINYINLEEESSFKKIRAVKNLPRQMKNIPTMRKP